MRESSKTNWDLSGWISKLFADDPLLNETYLTTEDAIDFEISEKGAEAIMALINKNEAENARIVIGQRVAQSVENTLTQQFGGDTDLMAELTGVEAKDIQQVPHQAIYLKNLIGPVLGMAQAITFDMHTGTIYNPLIKKSRAEVLGIFFQHFTPKTMAKALINDLGHATPEEKTSLKSLLPEEKYWDAADSLNLQGAVELLNRYQYFVPA